MDLRIISIGTLPAHPLWGEKAPVRTGHSTTTLVRTDQATILVDPGLPDQMITARLAERANLKPGDISAVFLTSYHTDTHRGITAFDDVPWYISRDEREGAGVALISLLTEANRREEVELVEKLKREIAVLQRCQEAPDSLAEDVDLFPLPGVTPGMCGLMVGEPEQSTLICGDAIPTVEHLTRKMVMPNCADTSKARASFAEALQIADILVLGRDNWVYNTSDFTKA